MVRRCCRNRDKCMRGRMFFWCLPVPVQISAGLLLCQGHDHLLLACTSAAIVVVQMSRCLEVDWTYTSLAVQLCAQVLSQPDLAELQHTHAECSFDNVCQSQTCTHMHARTQAQLHAIKHACTQARRCAEMCADAYAHTRAHTHTHRMIHSHPASQCRG